MNIIRLNSKWTLPPPRDFGWKMKSLDSARTNFVVEKNGLFKLSIEHDLIKGVSPEMLLWWFHNIGGEMTYMGKTYPKYLVWHPTDHIHWRLSEKSKCRKVGVGSYFRIVEAFGGNLNFLVDSTERVEKLDKTGIRLVRKMGGIPIFSLQHDFTAVDQSTRYTSTMIIGVKEKVFGTVFNSLLRPLIFTKPMAYAWLTHNVEEVGNFEHFLPELYKKCTKHDPLVSAA